MTGWRSRIRLSETHFPRALGQERWCLGHLSFSREHLLLRWYIQTEYLHQLPGFETSRLRIAIRFSQPNWCISCTLCSNSKDKLSRIRSAITSFGSTAFHRQTSTIEWGQTRCMVRFHYQEETQLCWFIHPVSFVALFSQTWTEITPSPFQREKWQIQSLSFWGSKTFSPLNAKFMIEE